MSTSLGYFIDPALHSELEVRKDRIASLLSAGEALLFSIAREVREIEAMGLYRADAHPDTGEPFRTMTEYYPFLLSDLKARSRLHKLSERLVREVVRLDKVFVQGLGIPPEQILEEGVSRYTEAAEALDYNPRTGEISDTPREGKLSKEEVLQILQQARDGDWPLDGVRAELTQRRGVERSYVRLEWICDHDDGTVRLRTVWLHRGDSKVDVLRGWVDPADAREVDRLLRALSNLPEELGEEA